MAEHHEADTFYLLRVYVPSSHSESVKEALFEAGAGNFGLYDCCAWETRGTGQFRPLEGSDPYAGRTGEVEKAEEVKIETVCVPSRLQPVIDALKQAHPYETPAFQYWEVYGDI